MQRACEVFIASVVFTIAAIFAWAPAASATETSPVGDVECGAPSWTQAQRDAFRDEVLRRVNAGEDLGAPPCGVVEECSIGIDPVESIQARVFDLTFNGTPVEYDTTAVYDGATPNHLANFPLTGVVFGSGHVTYASTWNAGTGTFHGEGDVNCPEAPPTTTTTAPPTTTTAPPTVVTSPPKDTDHPTPPPSMPTESSLPVTGSTSAPLTMVGVAAVAAGLAMMRPARAWAWRRVPRKR